MQITIIQRRLDSETVASISDLAQLFHLQLSDNHISLPVLEKISSRQRYGSAVFRAYADDGEIEAFSGESSGDACRPRRFGDSIG